MMMILKDRGDDYKKSLNDFEFEGYQAWKKSIIDNDPYYCVTAQDVTGWLLW